MELDDLKKAWAEQPLEPPEKLEPSAFERRFSKKTASLRRSLFFEIVAVAAMLAAVAWLWFFGSIYRGLTAKALILGAFAGSAITFWRLFRAFRQLEEADFSKNVAENLHAALAAAERELLFYRWSAWIFLGFMFVVVCFDKWFLGMNWAAKSAVLCLLAFSVLTTRPYLNWVYGRKLKAIRQQIEAFLGDGQDDFSRDDHDDTTL